MHACYQPCEVCREREERAKQAKPVLDLSIITKDDLELYDKKGWLHDRILTKHTIEVMAGLLRKASDDFLPTNGKEVKWVKEVRAFLQQFDEQE